MTAEAVHGTRRRYRQGCREECCRAAIRAYDKRRRHLLARGLSSMADASPVRAHVLWLAGYGISPASAAKKAGVGWGVVERLLYGSPSRGLEPSRKVRRSHAEALLGVERVVDNVTDLARTPSADTLRKLRGLVAAGWSQSELARRLDVQVGPLNKHLLGYHEFVSGSFARRVRALHTELADITPPRGTPGEKAAVSHALRVARQRGWNLEVAS